MLNIWSQRTIRLPMEAFFISASLEMCTVRSNRGLEPIGSTVAIRFQSRVKKGVAILQLVQNNPASPRYMHIFGNDSQPIK